MCDSYFSKHLDGKCLGLDFFSQQPLLLQLQLLWCNAPFDLKCLLNVVRRFLRLGLKGYLLLPVWASQPFFKLARKNFPHSIRLTQHQKLFRPSWNLYSKFVHAPGWQIEIFMCNMESESLFRGRWIVNSNSILDERIRTDVRLVAQIE